MLAYLCTPFSGFIPCKLLARVPGAYSGTLDGRGLLIKLTAARPGYAKGAEMVVSRGQIARRPLRRSRGSGRLYSYTIPWPSLDHLPERT